MIRLKTHPAIYKYGKSAELRGWGRVEEVYAGSTPPGSASGIFKERQLKALQLAFVCKLTLQMGFSDVT